MNVLATYSRYRVAFLIAGSAVLLLSCGSKKDARPVNPETLVTMSSEDLGMKVSKNGLKSYYFTTSLMEEYNLAGEPYTKYPRGVFVETFQDSTEVVESTLRANEAIYYKRRDLWMASGDVVAYGSGNTLYTEQLFWDAKTDRIYSNVRVKVVDKDGEHYGEGFESDKDLKTWVFKDYEGTIAVDTSPNGESVGETETASQPGGNVGIHASPDEGSIPSTSAIPENVPSGQNPSQDTVQVVRSQKVLKDAESGTVNTSGPEPGSNNTEG